MKEVPNLINICPTNAIQILNIHGFFFGDFMCVLQIALLTEIKKKKIDVGTGGPQQRLDVN